MTKMGRPRSKPAGQDKKTGRKKEENAAKSSAAQLPRKRGRPKKEAKTTDVKEKNGVGITKPKERTRGLGKTTKKEIVNAALKNEDTVKTKRGRKSTKKVGKKVHIPEEKATTSENGLQQTTAIDLKIEPSHECSGTQQKVTNENEMDAKDDTSDGTATQIDGPPKKVGVHVSMSGGLHNAVENALNMDAKAFGLFLRNQRQWASKPLSDEDADKFKKACAEANYSPDVILPHGIYLMNCASPDDDALQKSRETLIDELKRCEKLGLKLYNFHPGSTCGKIPVENGIERIAKSINDAHQETKFVVTLVENMCCQGHTVSILTLRVITMVIVLGDRHINIIKRFINTKGALQACKQCHKWID